MQHLGDIIIDVLDNAVDIPSYLASSLFPEEFRAPDILPKISASRNEQWSR